MVNENESLGAMIREYRDKKLQQACLRGRISTIREKMAKAVEQLQMQNYPPTIEQSAVIQFLPDVIISPDDIHDLARSLRNLNENETRLFEIQKILEDGGFPLRDLI